MNRFKANIRDIRREQALKETLGQELANIIIDAYEDSKDVVFVCVGTERVAFDSFGPITGSTIKQHLQYMPNFKVYGEVRDNIDAMNAQQRIKAIKENEPNSVIIAIDALAVKNKQLIGDVLLRDTPIHPGAANNKGIEAIGDHSIVFAACLRKEDENGQYKIDTTTGLNRKEIIKCVETVVESLEIACDHLISHMARGLY